MRIAYVSLYFDKYHTSGGVGEKVRSQTITWQTKGHIVQRFFLTPDEIVSEDIKFFQYKTGKKNNFIQRLFSRRSALVRLIAAVQRFAPDIIYLRHGLYIHPAHKIFNIAPVVLEINSDDVQEFSLHGFMFNFYNLFTRRIFLKKSKGIVFVTRELKNLVYNQAPNKLVCVISNGIDLEKNLPLPAPRHNLPVLTIIGSPGMPWHGVDKLLPLAKKYPDLKINIVGYSSEDIREKEPKPLNIHFWGFLGRDKVREVLADTDVVCGTLALHRKKMNEASPLKVREAAALGIPLILGYEDTDLSEVQTDCIFQIPNTEDNVSTSTQGIYSFTYQMMGKRLQQTNILPRIDRLSKEEQRLSFFQNFFE